MWILYACFWVWVHNLCLSSGHRQINVSAVAVSIYIYSVYIYILFISKRVWGQYGELILVKIQ